MRDDLRDIILTFRGLLRGGTTGLVAAFCVIAAVRLVFHTPSWVVAYLQADALNVGSLETVTGLATASVCTGILQLAGELGLGAWQVGLLRSIRAFAKRGQMVEHSAVDVLRRAATRYKHVLAVYLIVVVATAAGSFLCCIGAVAALFALSMSLYLVSSREQPIQQALKNSVQMAKTRPYAVGAAAVGTLGVAVVAALLGWGLQSGLVALAGPAGLLIAAPLAFAAGSAAAYLALLWLGSVGFVIERAGMPFTLPPDRN